MQNFITLGQPLRGEFGWRAGCWGYVAWVAEDMLQFLEKQSQLPILGWEFDNYRYTKVQDYKSYLGHYMM